MKPRQELPPLDPKLTRAGTPRKNAPGAGRRPAGRTEPLPRIRPHARGQLECIAELEGITLAEALELSAEIAYKRLFGRRIRTDAK